MKELTVFEMEEISGGALSETMSDVVTWIAQEIGAITLGASLGALLGTAYAGRWGGVSGGIFGIGSIGQGVGMIAGVILGGVCFGIAAAVVGWDTTFDVVMKGLDGLIDGTFNIWSN
ncbi:TPA: hypothetical protein ACXP8L_003596 [Klebsiella variicola subsp. variicola]